MADKQAGAIDFGHTFFWDREQLIRNFSRHGFSPILRETFDENRTLFPAFVKSPIGERVLPVQDGRARRNAALVRDFYAYFSMISADITDRAVRHSGRRYICPASCYTQVLLYSGLDVGLFDAILDNAPHKIGQRLYGCGLPVVAPASCIPTDAEPPIVLNAGAHTKELTDRFAEMNDRVQVIGLEALR